MKKTIAFFLEEPSAREALKGILPKVISMEHFFCQYVVFEGKQDLDKKLMKRLRGWRVPDTLFVVLRDKDSADCKVIKEKLTVICNIGLWTN